ncbi:uncharacterized protein LOC134213778 isoform X2 [Armigeres subalbatus]|uniref:uncharacterized protein LOC134213778 isoform X2 n=1 Tax=Armigeres subalbatus TaxID=124917 RepID=UPI002ED40FC2
MASDSENPPENLRCRFCLAEEMNELIPVFCIASTQNMLISHMALACTGLVVSSRDNMPQYSCDECLGHLDLAYACWKRCRQSWGNYKKNSSLKSDDEDYRCRICLKHEVDELVSIFCVCDSQSKTISDILKLFAGLTVTKNDKFPQFICDVCLAHLSAGYNFRKICRRSLDTLRRELETAKNQDLDEDRFRKEASNNSKNLDKSVLNEFLNFHEPSIQNSPSKNSPDKQAESIPEVEYIPDVIDELEISMPTNPLTDSCDPLKIEDPVEKGNIRFVSNPTHKALPSNQTSIQPRFVLANSNVTNHKNLFARNSAVKKLSQIMEASLSKRNKESTTTTSIESSFHKVTTLAAKEPPSNQMNQAITVPSSDARCKVVTKQTHQSTKTISTSGLVGKGSTSCTKAPPSNQTQVTSFDPGLQKVMMKPTIQPTKSINTTLEPRFYKVSTVAPPSNQAVNSASTSVVKNFCPISLGDNDSEVRRKPHYSWAQIVNFQCKNCQCIYKPPDAKEECTVCKLKFDNYFSSGLDMQTYDKEYISAYRCNECDFFTIRLEPMINHLTTHQKYIPHSAVMLKHRTGKPVNVLSSPLTVVFKTNDVSSKPTKKPDETTNMPKPPIVSRQIKQITGNNAAKVATVKPFVYIKKIPASTSTLAIKSVIMDKPSVKSGQSENNLTKAASVKPHTLLSQLNPSTVVSKMTKACSSSGRLDEQQVVVSRPTSKNSRGDIPQPTKEGWTKVKPAITISKRSTEVISDPTQADRDNPSQMSAKKLRLDTSGADNSPPTKEGWTRVEPALSISDSDPLSIDDDDADMQLKFEHEPLDIDDTLDLMPVESIEVSSEEEFEGFEEDETMGRSSSIDTNHFQVMLDSDEYLVVFLKGVLCCGCSMVFDTRYQLQNHREQHHRRVQSSATPTMCIDCKTGTSSSSSHRVLSAKRIFYFCKLCSKLLLNVVDFYGHRRIEHALRDLPPRTYPTKPFVLKQGAETLLRTIENYTHYAQPFNMIENEHIFHIVKETNEYKLLFMTGHLCCGCQHWFISYDALLAHCDETHDRHSEPDTSRCDLCQIDCKSESRLMRHRLQRSRRLHYYCKLCHDILIYHADNYQAHRMVAHRDTLRIVNTGINKNMDMLVCKVVRH